MNKVDNLMLHNALGESIQYDQLINWNPPDGSRRPFLSNRVSWKVGDLEFSKPLPNHLRVKPLPDNSGFICFENAHRFDNCYIIDAYGKELYRLTVPWGLTGRDVPKDAEMWFCNVRRHIDGQFGLSAWVEFAGEYYFELDYHTGKFLWGKEIRL